MHLSKKQLLQLCTGIYLFLPLVLFYIGRYFKSNYFLDNYRLAPALQGNTLQFVGIFLIFSCFIAVLYFLWTTLISWTNTQKTISSILLFLFPIAVSIILGLAYLDLKLWEPKERSTGVYPIPNSSKYLNSIVVEKGKLFKSEPIFIKTLLFTRQAFSPIMKKVGETDCPIERIEPKSSSIQVIFADPPKTEADSILQSCELINVY